MKALLSAYPYKLPLHPCSQSNELSWTRKRRSRINECFQVYLAHEFWRNLHTWRFTFAPSHVVTSWRICWQNIWSSKRFIADAKLSHFISFSRAWNQTFSTSFPLPSSFVFFVSSSLRFHRIFGLGVIVQLISIVKWKSLKKFSALSRDQSSALMKLVPEVQPLNRTRNPFEEFLFGEKLTDVSRWAISNLEQAKAFAIHVLQTLSLNSFIHLQSFRLNKKENLVYS